MSYQISNALDKFRGQDFDGALSVLERILKTDQDNVTALLMRVRCQLALQQPEAALFSYQAIIKYPKIGDAAKAEANLYLGNFLQAISIYKHILQQNAGDDETLFLASVACYKLGQISASFSYLERAVESDFEWEDDTPVDFLLQHIFARIEFNDFEQLYLDVGEKVEDGKGNPKNRWFSINMPIYDFFTASPEKQEKKAQNFAALLDRAEYFSQIKNGQDEISQILKDFAASQQDARFGLEALKSVSEEKYHELASLILAMQLEHLKQFADLFGLANEAFDNSQLQNLIPQLPLKIAIILMFLYASSEPKDQIQQMAQQNIDKTILIKLLVICFTTFYDEINSFKNLTSNKT